VKKQFLPIVHVDYRTRVADALASKFSLKALQTPVELDLSFTWNCLPIVSDQSCFISTHPWSFISGPSAFRLKAHPGALYETTVEKGRPVLQGPMAANLLVIEVCGHHLSCSSPCVLTLMQMILNFCGMFIP
jgi:exocyst complex component 4